MVAVPASAVALTTQTASGAAPAGAPLKIDVEPQRLDYGEAVTVTGSVPAADGGTTLTLERAPARGGPWQALTSTRIARDGRFALRTPLRRSGLLRVLDADRTPDAQAAVSAPGAQTITTSMTQPVTVGAQLRLASRPLAVLAGQQIDLRGRMLPSTPGRQVRLQGRSGRAWDTITTTRTGGHGGFDLRYRTASVGHRSLRVLFSGDRANSRVLHPAGTLDVYEPGVASWYYDGAGTGCGFHATFGVANRDLPCGTRVGFRYGGRSVTAIVDDRGPYVGGRDWDLNQNTAAALGFAGVATVWSTR